MGHNTRNAIGYSALSLSSHPQLQGDCKDPDTHGNTGIQCRLSRLRSLDELQHNAIRFGTTLLVLIRVVQRVAGVRDDSNLAAVFTAAADIGRKLVDGGGKVFVENRGRVAWIVCLASGRTGDSTIDGKTPFRAVKSLGHALELVCSTGQLANVAEVLGDILNVIDVQILRFTTVDAVADLLRALAAAARCQNIGSNVSRSGKR